MELENGDLRGETDFVRNHKHTFTIPAGENQALTDKARGHFHIVTREGDDFTFGPPLGDLQARVPSYGEIQFYGRRGEEKQAGIDIGAERIAAGGYGVSGIARVIGLERGSKKIEHGYVEGGTLGAAEFTFDQVTPARYPDGITVNLSLRAYRSHKGDIESGIRGSVSMKHPSKEIETEPLPFVVDEYNIAELDLPLTRKGTDATVTRQLNVFEDLVEQGQIKLVIRCMDRSQYLGVTKSGVFLQPASNSFEWNLTKAYMSIWLQMTMVIAFGVMFSTFLSGPVAMISTAACVLLGFSAEQIYDTRHFIDAGIERGGGPIESVIRLLKQDAMTTQLDVDTTAASIIKTVDAGIIYSLDAVATRCLTFLKWLLRLSMQPVDSMSLVHYWLGMRWPPSVIASWLSLSVTSS